MTGRDLGVLVEHGGSCGAVGWGCTGGPSSSSLSRCSCRRAAVGRAVGSQSGPAAVSHIAGTYLEHRAFPLTCNRRHFSRVEDLYIGRLGVDDGPEPG